MTELGDCPLCRRKLVGGSNVNQYHLVPRSRNGRDTVALHRIGVAHRGDDAPDARGEQGVDARRRSAVAVAGLERHEDSRTFDVAPARPRIGECGHLRVRAARALVEAFAGDLAAVDDHAADARIRRRRVEAALGEHERARHVMAIVVGERARRRVRSREPVHAGRRAGFFGGRTASTSFSASRKSETSWNER